MDQHAVAGGVAENIVDALEAVEIEIEDSQSNGSCGRIERFSDLGEQFRAVAESGQGIVRGLPLQLFGQDDAIVDVDHLREQDAGLAIVVADQFDVEVRP